MTVRVGINGFGRIGRNFFRAAKAQGADIDFVAVNDLGSLETMAHLLQYDSVLGRFGGEVKTTGDGITVDGATIRVLAERNPGDLPWGDLGVDKGLMTTIHAYTGDQMLVDGPHSDLRRARAAAINIVPSSTGAARATGLVLQSMQGRLDGTSLRVPVPNGSITDFVGIVNRDVTVDEVNDAYREAAKSGPMANVLEYSEDPLVSSDIVGSPASCTFDSKLTMTQGNLVKVLGWYDNEWGYSNRLVDLVRIVVTSK